VGRVAGVGRDNQVVVVLGNKIKEKEKLITD
jgi:hypothetical protein